MPRARPAVCERFAAFGSAPNAAVASVLDYSRQPSYGSVALRAGFSADPFSIDLSSGGDVKVDYLGDAACLGYASSPPYRPSRAAVEAVSV